MFDKLLKINKQINEEYKHQPKRTIALLGNPNVGKSSVFNHLTGMHQHTGNWAGKTVAVAKGEYVYENERYEMIDLPGTYSLIAHSKEEEVTRDYICFAEYDALVIVCDATCLKRHLHLVLQAMEVTSNIVVVLNFMDEVKKQNIDIDVQGFCEDLKLPIVSMSARNHQGFDELKKSIYQIVQYSSNENKSQIVYPKQLQEALNKLENQIRVKKRLKRYYALQLLDPCIDDTKFYERIENKEEVIHYVNHLKEELIQDGIYEYFGDEISLAIQKRADHLCEQYIHYDDNYQSKKQKLDVIVTHRIWGPIWMLILLGIIFWITISFANIPSSMLSSMFTQLQIWLHQVCDAYHVSDVLEGLFVEGIVKTCGWVVAVMLPPMAIFFPLFTLLEDFGYLPRIAFNMDGMFQKANTCGKQALTMMMGFGCNAVGVSGARIIDSPREQLIAILTNALIPCNGRFPTLISIITLFFTGMMIAPWNHVVAAIILLGCIIFSVLLSLFVSYGLSKTILKGVPSSFTLELPPYRRPQVFKVIIRSIFDRTIFVLARAVCVAIPAGIILWFMANIRFQDVSILTHAATFLDSFGKLLGLDGMIILAFILGFPANEIVVPIMLMGYMSSGSMVEITNMQALYDVFVGNGWTWQTAICMLIFMLIHFPCATTVWTIKKETNEWKWAIISFVLPTCIGILLCMMTNLFLHCFI